MVWRTNFTLECSLKIKIEVGVHTLICGSCNFVLEAWMGGKGINSRYTLLGRINTLILMDAYTVYSHTHVY